MTSASPFDRLPSATRKRLEIFSQNVDKIGLTELPLFAASPLGSDHQRALDNAERVAIETGREAAVEEGRRIAWSYVARRYSEVGYQSGLGIKDYAPSLASGEDRARLARSFEEALTGIVLADVLDEADADEMLGAWANLTE